MQPTFKDLTNFLLGLGTEQVAHTEQSFLAHLIGVYSDLKKWGCDEELCRAGLFHSIYGTERFQRFCLPLDRRAEVRELIGERAERIAYLNCAMDRGSFDAAARQPAGPYRLLDRITGEEHDVAPADFDDLCCLHLCDWLEQVPRSKEWNYRRPAYRQLADRLGGVPQGAYDRVFAAE